MARVPSGDNQKYSGVPLVSVRGVAVAARSSTPRSDLFSMVRDHATRAVLAAPAVVEGTPSAVRPSGGLQAK